MDAQAHTLYQLCALQYSTFNGQLGQKRASSRQEVVSSYMGLLAACYSKHYYVDTYVHTVYKY